MATRAAMNTQVIREINTAAVLDHLRAGDARAVSVSSLAHATGLSRQAVTRALESLEVDGLVESLEPDRSAMRTGRPAHLVRFRVEAGYVVGISLAPGTVRLSVADLAGAVVAGDSAPLPDESGPQVTASVGDLLVATLEGVGLTPEAVWSIHVGVPGIVDRSTGAITLVASMPALHGDTLSTGLVERFERPVHLDNDINLATQAERWHTQRREATSLVLVHWGDRVGSGILLGGDLYRGATNDAGDLGFLDLMVDRTVEPAPAEHDSGLGRFEAWVGGAEIVRLATENARGADDRETLSRLRLARADALRCVLEGAVMGNESCLAAIRRVARRFARGIAAIRAILDPELMVIGGPVAACGDLVLEVIRTELASAPLDPPRVVLSELGEEAVVHGALRRALDDVESTRFTAPAHSGRVHATAAG